MTHLGELFHESHSQKRVPAMLSHVHIHLTRRWNLVIFIIIVALTALWVLLNHFRSESISLYQDPDLHLHLKVKTIVVVLSGTIYSRSVSDQGKVPDPDPDHIQHSF